MTDNNKGFKPRLLELKEQCPSCPFREGNDKEFAAVIAKLADDGSGRPWRPEDARAEVLQDVAKRGDFACHHTAYHADLSIWNPRPGSDLRQCPGATKYFNSQPRPGKDGGQQ